MTDRLEGMMARQLELFQAYHPGGSTIDANMKDLCLALIVEATEVLNLTNWKPWKKQTKSYKLSELEDEIVDCLHFVLEMAILAGMRPEDVFTRYMDKNKKNKRRLKNGY